MEHDIIGLIELRSLLTVVASVDLRSIRFAAAGDSGRAIRINLLHVEFPRHLELFLFLLVHRVTVGIARPVELRPDA